MNTMADANKYRDLTKGYGEGFLTAEQAKAAAANIKGIQNWSIFIFWIIAFFGFSSFLEFKLLFFGLFLLIKAIYL